MSAFPDPIWPVVVLALVQVIDGLLCLKPVAFVAKCFSDMNFPRQLWWLAAPIKFAAALGLIGGIYIAYLGTVTSTALVAYFVVAITMHVRARDFGRNLFVNATGMLILCVAVLLFGFLL